jgi:hypothetical protein
VEDFFVPNRVWPDVTMKPRYSMAALMVAVAYLAVAFAAWRSANRVWAAVTFNLTVAALLVSSYKARYSTGPAGAGWFGFALFGWAHLLLGLAVTPWRQHWTEVEVSTHPILWMLMNILPEPSVNPTSPESVMTGFFLLITASSLVVGGLGAIVIRAIAIRIDRVGGEADSRPAAPGPRSGRTDD